MIRRSILTLCTVSLFIFSGSFAQDLKKLNLELVNNIQSNSTSSNDQVNLLVQGDISSLRKFLLDNGGILRYHYGDIANIYIPINKVYSLSDQKWAHRIESPTNDYKLMNDTMRSMNYINPIQQGMAPLTNGLNGEDVVIGIIDSGVDFEHPDLQDSSGQTRILHLWDQNLPAAANTPLPFGYGQEWTGPEIDLGLASAHTDVAYFGHGTHVTGIAASNGLANGSNKGIAPLADIIEVAFDFNDQSHFTYADAVNYIYTKAAPTGKPCVINASLGDYYGSHDGQDLESQMISNMIDQQPGRSLVAAAGNAGTLKFHLGYQVTSDTSWTWVLHNGAIPQTYFQVWADTADFRNVSFTIGADANTTASSYVGSLPYRDIFDHLGVFRADTLFNSSGNRIGVIQSIGSLQGGSYSLEFNIIPDSIAYKWRWTTTGSGKFDIWKFLENTGISGFFISPLPSASIVPDIGNYMLPDADQTIVSGFQCLDNVIAVGNFGNRSEYLDVNNMIYSSPTTFPGVIAGSSSWGPTRDGRIKPDISASGGIMLSCGEQSLLNLWATTGQANKVAQGGMHFRDGGTSSSSPVVAGIAALYLELYPTASAMDVKNAILQCAIQDTITGFNLPDNIYGHGKVDGFGTIVNCGFTGINDIDAGSNSWIHPNPVISGNVLYIDLSVPISTINVFDISGKLIQTTEIENSQSFAIETQGLNAGMYFIKLLDKNTVIDVHKLSIINK